MAAILSLLKLLDFTENNCGFSRIEGGRQKKKRNSKERMMMKPSVCMHILNKLSLNKLLK